MTLICVPMAVGQALYRVWVYGDVMCKLTSYLQGILPFKEIASRKPFSVGEHEQFLSWSLQLNSKSIRIRTCNFRVTNCDLLFVYRIEILIFRKCQLGNRFSGLYWKMQNYKTVLSVFQKSFLYQFVCLVKSFWSIQNLQNITF